MRLKFLDLITRASKMHISFCTGQKTDISHEFYLGVSRRIRCNIVYASFLGDHTYITSAHFWTFFEPPTLRQHK